MDNIIPTITPRTNDILGRALTAREQEILTQLAAGSTNLETSEALKISVKTVEAHRARLFKKLGANNAPQAITIAYQQRLLNLPMGIYTSEELVAELSRREAEKVAVVVTAVPSAAVPS